MRKRRSNKPKGYWQGIENRKEFFYDFARELKFDPTIPSNWRKVTKAQILERGVSKKREYMTKELKKSFLFFFFFERVLDCWCILVARYRKPLKEHSQDPISLSSVPILYWLTMFFFLWVYTYPHHSRA